MATLVHVPHIVTAKDHQQALERIDAIIDAPDGSPAAEERAVLADLVSAWEERHHPIPRLSGRALVAACMKAAGLSQSQVPEIGLQPLVSAVLAGKRPITPRMALALSKRFCIAPDSFL
jgi:HTH-type transcriptional regulator / antitoxin HigA